MSNEIPVLCRALRYGMCLKLEEMFAQYNDVSLGFNQQNLLDEINEGLDLDNKENSSPVKAPKEEVKESSPMKKVELDPSDEFDKKYNLIEKTDKHFEKVKNVHLNKIRETNIKK
jgi:hypothetical protein